MRSINEGIRLRPRSNAVEADLRHAEAKPRLALVPGTGAGFRRWAAGNRWAFALLVVCGVFAVTLVTYVLLPAATTLVGNSVESWSQQGP
jgi:hypothetical protein